MKQKHPSQIPSPPKFGVEQVSQQAGRKDAEAPEQIPMQSIDRRRSRRVTLSVPARVRRYYQVADASDELLPATNLSRDGFYFISRRPSYCEDMNLYVACPAGHSQTPADAECARVVRVDSLSEDSWGVAVTFVRSTISYHNGTSSQR